MGVDNRIPSEPYMELNGVTINITSGHDREFTVVINSTRIQKPKVNNVTLVKANDETVAVQLPDGRIVHIDKEQIDG